MENKPSQDFEHVVLTISNDLAEQRIDKALASIPQIATRSQASRLIQSGRVRINDRVLKPSYHTKVGDRIDIDIPLTTTSELVPYEFPLTVPYEDEAFLIVDKPAGLVVHPACGHPQDTLVNALLYYTKDLSLGFNEQRPGLVHRIDKDTSGLLVVAKTEEAHRAIALQFQKKTTHRLYRAIAFGKFAAESGAIRSNLKRHPLDRKRVASSDDGRPAVTHYNIVSFHPSGVSLVELRLETGRTHQIRVHLSEKGHPIIGDHIYGADKRLKSLKSPSLRKLIEEMPRFALHAMELGFLHPTSKKFMKFAAPWPQDLLPIIEHCDFPRYHESYETTVGDS